MKKLEITKQDARVFRLDVLSGRKVNVFMEQSHTELRVLREDWLEIVDDINKINDEFRLFEDDELVAAGRLATYENRNDFVRLEIASWEEDALFAQPTNSTEKFDGTLDSDVVENAIDRVPGLEPGTIETIADNISFVFSNTSPAKMIRNCQSTSGAFVRYNPDKTVDYIANPDGLEPSLTIGPREGNVEDEIRVIENEREEFTHVRVLGANEGEARIQAEGSLDDVSGRQKWGKYTDKSITSQNRAEKVLDRLLEEYREEPRRLKIETTVFGSDISVGTRLRVVSPGDSIDKVFWVIENEKVFEGSQSVSEVVLSNRLLTDENDGRRQRQSIEEFNSGFQGVLNTLNSGGYRAPIDSDNPYVFSIRKPDDVIRELNAQLEIDALPYRAYSSGASASDQLDETTTSSSRGVSQPFNTAENTSHSGIDVATGFNADIPDVLFGDFSGMSVSVYMRNGDTVTQSIPFSVNIEGGQELTSHTFDMDPNEGRIITRSYFESSDGVTPDDTVNITLDDTLTSDAGEIGSVVRLTVSSFSEHSHTFGDTLVNHKHNADPGIIEFQEFPSNVNVRVNGQRVASDVGSGEFSTVVDIGDVLRSGFNTVEVTSDSLGHMRATAFLDVYRQITQ